MEPLKQDLFQDPEVEEKDARIAGMPIHTIPEGTLTFPVFDTDIAP